MSNFKMFSVGDIVTTLSGFEIEILKTDGPDENCPIIGMRTDNGYPMWFAEREIIPPKRTREVTVWCNLYSDGWTDVRETEDDAKDIASCNLAQDKLLAVAVPVTFTVEY